jgi:4-amino-4-deoxy-L-arabinose transferase-like glycosyltransferase
VNGETEDTGATPLVVSRLSAIVNRVTGEIDNSAASIEASRWTSLHNSQFCPLKLLLLSLVLRMAVSIGWLGSLPMLGDAADYYGQAVELFEGTRPDVPFYWPPGTSFFLEACFWLFGVSVTSARVGLAVLGTLHVALVARLTMEISGSHRVARAAGWLAAIYPAEILLSFESCSQHLSLFCLTGTALFGLRLLKSCTPRFAAGDADGSTPLRAQCRPFDRLRDALVTGAFLGVGCLTRPSMMGVVALVPLAAVIAWWCTWSHDRRRGAIRFAAAVTTACAVAFAVTLPVVQHNLRTGGGFTLSTNNERNLFLGNNPFTPHYKTSHFAQRSLDELPADVQLYLRSYYESENPRQAMKEATAAYVREHPWITMLRTANRARAFFGFDYIASRQIPQAFGWPAVVALPLLVLEAGGYVLVMLLGLAGLFVRKPFPRGGTWWLLALLAAYAGPYCLAFSAGTYHFPILGLVLPFAGASADALLAGRWRDVLSRRATWVAWCTFAAVQVEYAWFSLRHAG